MVNLTSATSSVDVILNGLPLFVDEANTLLGVEMVASRGIPLLPSGALFAADKPSTINIDWATYNPVSILLKDKGWLEKEFEKGERVEGIPVFDTVADAVAETTPGPDAAALQAAATSISAGQPLTTQATDLRRYFQAAAAALTAASG